MIKGIKLNLKKLKTQKRKEKAVEASNRMLQIFQMDRFREEIIRMDRSKWLKGETKGSPFLKLSNIQIYNKIMSGKEEWNDDNDREIDMIIASYNKPFSRVVGYMNPGKPTVHVNTKFFDKRSLEDICSNFAHEYMHTIGSRHSGKYFRSSFPYYINTVIKRLYPLTSNEKEVTEKKSVKVCRRAWWKLWLGYDCNYVVRR